jgi:aspartyl-tRNA(Asn)/glutamyl-tRNA(Gln) amidotransferase subunit C
VADRDDQRVPSDREHLTPEDVARVAQLALLDLTEDELGRFASQLDAVLDLADQLDRFDLDEVPPTSHPFGLVNVFREDVPDVETTGVDFRRLALDCGPEVEDGRFKVPPALGEAP